MNKVIESTPARPRFKNLLRLHRWQSGVKQYELANQLGCSAPYLSMVENGRIDPPKWFREKAAALLDLEVTALFPKNSSLYEEEKLDDP